MTVKEVARSRWVVYGDDGKILFVTTESDHLKRFLLYLKENMKLII